MKTNEVFKNPNLGKTEDRHSGTEFDSTSWFVQAEHYGIRNPGSHVRAANYSSNCPQFASTVVAVGSTVVVFGRRLRRQTPWTCSSSECSSTSTKVFLTTIRKLPC